MINKSKLILSGEILLWFNDDEHESRKGWLLHPGQTFLQSICLFLSWVNKSSWKYGSRSLYPVITIKVHTSQSRCMRFRLLLFSESCSDINNCRYDGSSCCCRVTDLLLLLLRWSPLKGAGHSSLWCFLHIHWMTVMICPSRRRSLMASYLSAKYRLVDGNFLQQ